MSRALKMSILERGQLKLTRQGQECVLKWKFSNPRSACLTRGHIYTFNHVMRSFSSCDLQLVEFSYPPDLSKSCSVQFTLGQMSTKFNVQSNNIWEIIKRNGRKNFRMVLKRFNKMCSVPSLS